VQLQPVAEYLIISKGDYPSSSDPWPEAATVLSSGDGHMGHCEQYCSEHCYINTYLSPCFCLQGNQRHPWTTDPWYVSQFLH
jgi:hypothetical protein